VLWITSLPTQASQRSVASAMNPNAASTANSGIASRPHEGCEPDGGDCGAGAGAAAGAAGGEGVDPGSRADGAGLI
jgi:hypothetical protein